MAKVSRREQSKQFSVSFPQTLLEEIDTICASNFMTRTAWLVKAAREKIEKERQEKEIKLKERLLES